MKMRWQKHDTPVEKFFRKCKYMELREAGENIERSIRFRDWTLNKVRLICSKKIKPI